MRYSVSVGNFTITTSKFATAVDFFWAGVKDALKQGTPFPRMTMRKVVAW